GGDGGGHGLGRAVEGELAGGRHGDGRPVGGERAEVDRLGELERRRRVVADVHDPAPELAVPLALVARDRGQVDGDVGRLDLGAGDGEGAVDVARPPDGLGALAEEHLVDPVAGLAPRRRRPGAVEAGRGGGGGGLPGGGGGRRGGAGGGAVAHRALQGEGGRGVAAQDVDVGPRARRHQD